ncbi:MAG: leucine-rich repeat protein [Clostridia bacterium]|nr:leucine-rich repeat protein [Clostridia bacterium]
MSDTIINENGLAISFFGYEDIVVPKNCIVFSDRVYEDFHATANERKSISVENGNPKFKSVNNCLIEIETGKVVLGCKNSVIPDDGSIKIIGAHSFSGIGDMESDDRDIFTHIAIPDSVEIIEHHAFADSGLTDIELPNSLKEIGSMAFMLTRIGMGGKSVCIPNTVEKMGIGVFTGCTELRRPMIFSQRYKIEGDCIVDTETNTIIAIHNGIAGEVLPISADKIEMLTFMGQKSGTKYYFEKNIKEIKVHPFKIPASIEFPITIVTHKDSYAHKFAIEHGIAYEIW